MRAIHSGEGEGGGRKRDALEVIQNAAKDVIQQLVWKYLPTAPVRSAADACSGRYRGSGYFLA